MAATKQGQEKKKRASFGKRLRRFFMTTVVGGLVVVLPITLLVIVVRWIIVFIVQTISPIKQLIQLPEELADWVLDLTAFGIVLGAFFLIGLIVQTNLGKQSIALIENQLLAQLPFYTTLRDTVQQFLGNRETMPFSQVVSVDVFGNTTRMIGFISEEMDDGRLTIFVPTGPNPTNGFIFCVSKEQVTRLDVRPDEAMRVVVGVGTGASNLFPIKKELAEPTDES
ncbi:MAG TPA: DUF502 domain-containing protein [Saprospiraceae bacterium]|nr:DUF502 domain-containing protein [Saprospiraceae bacterium]